MQQTDSKGVQKWYQLGGEIDPLGTLQTTEVLLCRSMTYAQTRIKPFDWILCLDHPTGLCIVN